MVHFNFSPLRPLALATHIFPTTSVFKPIPSLCSLVPKCLNQLHVLTLNFTPIHLTIYFPHIIFLIIKLFSPAYVPPHPSGICRVYTDCILAKKTYVSTISPLVNDWIVWWSYLVPQKKTYVLWALFFTGKDLEANAVMIPRVSTSSPFFPRQMPDIDNLSSARGASYTQNWPP